MPDRLWTRGLALAVLAGAALFVGQAIRTSGPPDGPVPVAYDRAACARCGMLVSEPGFAAQAHTHDGRVHVFDDPGCLLLFGEESGEPLAAAFVHHVEQERWIEASRAVFVPAKATPMGYGLGARDSGEAPGLSWEEARTAVVSMERARVGEVARARRP